MSWYAVGFGCSVSGKGEKNGERSGIISVLS